MQEIHDLCGFPLFHLDPRTAVRQGIWEQPSGMRLSNTLGGTFLSFEFTGEGVIFCFYDGEYYRTMKLETNTLTDILAAIRRNRIDLRKS